MNRLACFLILVFVAPATLVASEGDDAKVENMDELVQPFLELRCFDCHGDENGEAGIDLSALSPTISNQQVANEWLHVLEELQADLMPPLSEERPEANQRRQVMQTIERAIRSSDFGTAYQSKLLLPEYGNYVDHQTLFDGSIESLPFSPSRLWRLSPEIYLSQFGNKANRHQSPFVYSTPESGFRDYAAANSVDQSTIEMIMVTVEKMLELEMFKVRGGEKRRISFRAGTERIETVDPDPDHRYAPFDKAEPPTSEEMQRLINDEFNRVHRRRPDETELTRYLDFLQENIVSSGELEAMKATVMAIHLSPEAIYRLEIGLGPSDEHGRRRLSPDELAHALSYALTNDSPYRQAIVSRALSEGRLSSVEGLHETVKLLLSDVENSRTKKIETYAKRNPRILRFFQEYFGYTNATSVFKDDQRKKQELVMQSPSQVERQAVKDLDVLILHILAEDKDVLRQLLTTEEYFVAHSGDSDLVRQRYFEFLDKNQEGRFQGQIQEAVSEGLVPFPGNLNQFAHVKLYNIPHGPGRNGPQQWSYPLDQPVPIKNRMGVLTHPAWLWSQSTNFDNDPIHRGIWIYRKLLAGIIPDVPPDVDARVPEDPHKTLRERLDVVRADSCWKCHHKINPLGETFQIFDDFGRFREQLFFDPDNELVSRRDGVFERLERDGQLTRRRIDATGDLNGMEDESLNGEVRDAFELIERLASSERVRQSFVRHTFRFFMGRNEMLSDSKTLIEADRAYVESGGSFRALVASLLTSDSFVYRK